MILEYLSNIELYYSPAENFKAGSLTISGDEFKHAVKVMRHLKGDEIHVTDGIGNIFLSKISSIKKDYLAAEIEYRYSYKNPAENVYFCIPILKNPDRFKFALEKSVELGITNFIVFYSEHTISKSSKIKRWEKIAISAMKQSLRAFKPVINFSSIKDILSIKAEKLLFDQTADSEFKINVEKDKSYYFLFGPEGGFSETEMNSSGSVNRFKLSNHRLRSETAIVNCASLLKLS